MTAGETETASLKSRFDAVYRENHWGDSESASGAGSRLDSLCVKDAEDAIDHAIREFGVGSVVDAPCGDFNWMRRFLEAHPGLGYRGIDIVEDLVARNRDLYPAHAFHAMNLAEEIPPAADLVLCKDLVNHLSDRDVCRVLHNIKASKPRFLLMSNNRGCANVELPFDIGGMSRHLDVTRAPFGFPPPIWETHYLGLWRADQIPEVFVLPERLCVDPEATVRSPADDLGGGAVLMGSGLPLQVFCGRATRGIVLFGPYIRVKAGHYRASFRIHCVADGSSELKAPCARVEVAAEAGGRVICARSVAPADLRSDPRVVLNFDIDTEQVLELRVYALGDLDMIVDHARPLVRAEERFRSAP